MVKTVVYNTLNLEGAEVKVDLASGAVGLRVRYHLAPSKDGPALAKEEDASHLLSEGDRAAILDLAGRLKTALEAQELV